MSWRFTHGFDMGMSKIDGPWPETGLWPLAAVALSKAKAVFAAMGVGGTLSAAATTAWLVDAFGGDDDDTLAEHLEPLPEHSRAYFLAHDLVAWRKMAHAKFTGPRLQAALQAVAQGEAIIGAPETTRVDVVAVAKSIKHLFFAQLEPKEKAAALPSPPHSTTSASTPANARSFREVAPSKSLWPWIASVGVFGVAGLWWWTTRSTTS